MKKLGIQNIFTILVSTTCASSVFANRFDEAHRRHCGPMSREECVQQIDDVKQLNCITDDEYRFALQEGKNNGGAYIVPFCTVKGIYKNWCFCSCLAKGTLVLVQDKTNSKMWLPIETVVEEREKYAF